MRVVVVGATGNAGTAVLRALQSTPEITSVLGIARREPESHRAPYSGCEWAFMDIAAASEPSVAAARLRELFAGADAVIHLAWLIQPNRNRELLRRVNVDGTAIVAEAAASAGVAQLVVASSVGAYSPVADTARRDESWPTDGIGSSHYSVDKAAQERVLDRFSEEHPEVVVTRMRPALIFQSEAGAEMQRYFLGSLVPSRMLRPGALPLLPTPDRLRGLQAVHADDLGRAYAAAVVRRAAGAFNICADEVLTPSMLSDILAGGRRVRVRSSLARAAVAAAHRLRLVPVDAGWLDMAIGAPFMDSQRAKDVLDWHPQHSASAALRSVLQGIAAGDGAGSVPLRARDSARDEPMSTRDLRDIDERMLRVYLRDHLVGATAGTARLSHMEQAYADTPMFARVSELAHQVRQERVLLQRIMRRLGVRPSPIRAMPGRVAELAGRLKGNGRVLRRSSTTPVFELEMLRGAVMVKLGLWQSLADNAEHLGLDAELLERLAEQARTQAAVLDELHAFARARGFRTDRSPFAPHALGRAGSEQPLMR